MKENKTVYQSPALIVLELNTEKVILQGSDKPRFNRFNDEEEW